MVYHLAQTAERTEHTDAHADSSSCSFVVCRPYASSFQSYLVWLLESLLAWGVWLAVCALPHHFVVVAE